MASPIRPYQISVPDSAIHNLKDKLAAATLPEASDFSDDRDSGAPLSEITRLAQRWRDGFDWRKQEAQINKDLPQYTTTIKVDGFDELNIHFVHQRSVREGSIPLVFCHGCELCTSLGTMTMLTWNIRAWQLCGGEKDPAVAGKIRKPVISRCRAIVA